MATRSWAWGLALGIGLGGCASDSAPPEVDDVVATIEAVSVAPGTQLPLYCAEVRACVAVEAGDEVGSGRVLSLGRELRLLLGESRMTLSPGAEIMIDADGAEVIRGDVELSRAEAAGAGTLWVFGRALELEPGRASLRVSVGPGRATLEVARGRATLSDGPRSLSLARGQAVELSPDGPATVDYLTPPVVEIDEPNVAERTRGLGRMAARRPGREEVMGGVALARHDLSIDVRDGVATTTIDEVFENTTGETLEGRFLFPVPPGASVTDLTLWVDGQPVAAEMVERGRAARIFKGIVDDTVRPRDPALLEWVMGCELSLKIFPIGPRATRTVRVRLEQRVAELDGRAEIRYPLASAGHGTEVGRLSARVHLDGGVTNVESPGYAAKIESGASSTDVTFEASGFAPTGDFIVRYRTSESSGARLVVEPSLPCLDAPCAPMIDGAGVLTVWLEPGAVAPSAGTVEPNRVIVLDTSASQTEASLRTGRALAERLLDGMSEDQRFALIACDSACESFPSTGLVTAAEVDVARARAWLRARAARGSSDVAGGLEAGLERLAGQPLGQLVYVGDGVASAGPIRGAEIAARVTRALARWPADVRLVGTGRNIDAPSLRAIAEALEATVDLLEPGEPRELAEIAAGLDRPALRDLRVTLPEGMVLAIDPPAAARLGDELELFVLGRGEGEVSVEAAAAAGAVRLSRPISSREGARGYATRSFARAKIERLEASEEHVAEVTALSTQYFVLSRHTSMLVLENDAMFAAFGIERTRGASSGASLALEGSGGTTGTGLGYGAVAANVPPPSGSFSAPFTLGGSGAQVSGGQVGSGAGTGSGLASGSHASSQPKVTMGVASTAGSLPPEVIRRIMRMQTGRFRMCYQRGLQLDPTLSGRIVVRFTIGPSGSVTSAASAGSTVQNAQVVACVVDAFKRMSFPQPEGGGVTVVSPLAFSPDGASSSPLVAFKGTPFGIGLSQGDDGWMKGSPQHLTALEEAVKREPTSRRRRTELVRAQLAAGRFADAVVSARAFADVDPDGALARELLASALIASGDEAQALWEIQALAELSPTSAVVHARVAASLEAANDEPRACAHWISAAELGADPRVQAEALRCRARVLRERDVVLSELAEASAQPLKSLREALERGMAPAYSPPAARHSEVVAKVTCDGAKAACPRVVIVDGRGGVVSDLLPNAAGRSGAPAFNGGSFKALLVGGSDAALARVTLTVGGQTKVSETTRGARATAAVANVPTGMF